MDSWCCCDVGENVGNCGRSSVSTMAAAREHRKRRRRYWSDSSTKTVAVNIIAIMMVLSITAAEGTRHRDVGDRRLHHQTFDAAKVRSDPLLAERERWLRQTPAISRILDENNGDDDAAAQEYDDDANAADDNVDDANKDDGYSTPAPTLPPTSSEFRIGFVCLSHNVPDCPPPQYKQPTMIMRNKSRKCVRINPAPSTSSAPNISLASYRAQLMPTIVARES